MDKEIIKRIYDVAIERKSANPETSYVASLYKKGEDKILEKVGEEAIETILAHKSGDKEQIVYETADLWFHSIVALAQKEIDVTEVLHELDRRFGKTGIREEPKKPE
ncbi:Phosphoribosyl-ATP pyrophosphatase [hydrothermal vent metagenome]|uniref:phosphoribosyl-ATP diphosphatase n=1 Tax=hydrothermal vent metagenome TaxID=652676 RepID=A0A3B1BXR1_9ZZZZ